MKDVRSFALILNLLFILQTPTWAQTVAKEPEVEAITPRSDETYWTPKRMREAKPMPMPSIPEGYRYPGESTPSPRQIPGHTDAHEPTPPVIPNVPN
jgi:hypothetical protein